MYNMCVKKALIFTVIFSFIGACIAPGISETLKNEGNQKMDDDISISSTMINYELNKDEKIDLLSIDVGWQWAKRAGGTGYDIGNSVSVDGNGNTYITGGFDDAVDFGSYSLTSQGGLDVFIAKLNSNGDWQWAKRAGGTSSDEGVGVSVDINGNTYITGYFKGTVDFGSYSLTSQGSFDVFIAKLNSNGDWQWAKRAGGTGSDRGDSISVDGNGNIYITGGFDNTLDVFIAKLDTNGDWQWTKIAGGIDDDYGYGVSVDINGNTYITGDFYDTVDFGTYSLTSQGSWDVFIAKLDTNGDWQWAKRAGGTGSDRGYGVSVDINGNTYITGHFKNTVDFGSYSLTSQGGLDVFIAKLNSNGDWQWAKRAGGTGYDIGNSVSVDINGNTYITGGFDDAADFGTYSL
ncbi:unnamed protein product, partial [marine sediment metagenome]